ncbi:MAG TPA: GNAT family N-acetyltransferase [Thermoplasmata archaeon]|nr:GNAT family N-acetyltransferase [Thermoplasmata archaeon]
MMSEPIETEKAAAIRVTPTSESEFPWIMVKLREQAIDYMTDGGSSLSLYGGDEHAESMLRLLRADHILLTAVTETGEAVGFIAGWVSGHPFNPAVRVATHFWWYVDPVHRHSRAASLLLSDFVVTAEDRGCQRITLCLGPRTMIRDESLEKIGFKHSDRCYVKEI